MAKPDNHALESMRRILEPTIPGVTLADIENTIERLINPTPPPGGAVMPDEIPTLLTVHETATFLRCSRSTVDRLAKAGALPCVRISPGVNARTLFRRRDVVEYINNKVAV